MIPLAGIALRLVEPAAPLSSSAGVVIAIRLQPPPPLGCLPVSHFAGGPLAAILVAAPVLLGWMAARGPRMTGAGIVLYMVLGVGGSYVPGILPTWGRHSMGTAAAGRGRFGGRIVLAVFGFGVPAAGAAAQDIDPCAAASADRQIEIAAAASPGTPDAAAGSEAGRLDRLAARLAERRSALDRRRKALELARAHLREVDRPAGQADINRWRDCGTRSDALKEDVGVLQALTDVLTPEALGQVSASGTNGVGVFKPDVGWARTGLQVALRSAPDIAQEGVHALEEGVLVVRLADGGDWSVVATAFGIGFVPSSQLRSGW